MKMFNRRKGQSATEYLMTYGWAILAIVVVAGVLWNMGLFGGGSCGNSVTGFAGTQVSVKDFALTAGGSLTLSLRNAAGEDISIGNVTLDNIYSNTSAMSISTIPTAGAITFGATGATGTAGSCYSQELAISYTVGGMSHTARGTINGAFE
ncbi:MAG: hypothetical protein KAJ20_00590 [Candidatus Aenigmarchaeota archaeon]|nr:hypothetical protein [Candidatus Aenigmarchaeota archaeon]MCK5234469.1 hypothetical protein [Candidatus Aenigmarchaeota archaeon]MCK5289523.1 hypothetical protein [Candidatus Aenigmarchaeota archaeon]MCK5372817.1 hypothetical protein [Candidatus Aenigmarchaeota archaeon]MCK5452033.1 hypothetical protein [Candidatus Aenigmarchaeota archaeon]